MIFLKKLPYDSERTLLVHSPNRQFTKTNSEVLLFLNPYTEDPYDSYKKPETPIFFNFSEENESVEGNTDKEAQSSAASSYKSNEGSVKSHEGSVKSNEGSVFYDSGSESPDPD